MKAFFALSLVVNAVLLALNWRTPSRPVLRVSTAREVRVQPTATSTNSPARLTTQTQSYATPWQALAAADWRATADLLRAAGCPEETIRDLITMRLSRQYRERVQASLERAHTLPEWWRYHDPNPDQIADFRENLRLFLLFSGGPARPPRMG